MYFTICIPVYNRANIVVRTLDSLKKQTFQDFEVVVVDDGSTDNIKYVLEKWQEENSFKINYVYKENGGKHTALNKGIDLANGKFFLVLDSDDWLKEDALQQLQEDCKKIENDDEFSGVMARVINIENGEMIGDPFPESPLISSYVDYHFRLIYQMNVGDSCECNKTSIMKKYRFPEPFGTKFVPEAWLFDQIGVHYKLYCTNKLLRYSEYREDGISQNVMFKVNNNIGYLYHYISRLENVLPYVKVPLKIHIVAWWRYWQAVGRDLEGKGPRCKKITILGKIVKCATPVIDRIFRARYPKLFRAGR